MAKCGTCSFEIREGQAFVSVKTRHGQARFHAGYVGCQDAMQHADVAAGRAGRVKALETAKDVPSRLEPYINRINRRNYE